MLEFSLITNLQHQSSLDLMFFFVEQNTWYWMRRAQILVGSKMCGECKKSTPCREMINHMQSGVLFVTLRGNPWGNVCDYISNIDHVLLICWLCFDWLRDILNVGFQHIEIARISCMFSKLLVSCFLFIFWIL